MKLKNMLLGVALSKKAKDSADQIATVASGLAGHGMYTKIKSNPEMVTMMSGKKKQRISTLTGAASKAYSKFRGKVK